MAKPEGRIRRSLLRHWSFGFHSSFGLRHSSFVHLVVRVIRHRMCAIHGIEFFRRRWALWGTFIAINPNDAAASGTRNHLVGSAVHKVEHVKGFFGKRDRARAVRFDAET